MKQITIFLVLLLSMPLISSDTTFFNNPNDYFIMSNFQSAAQTADTPIITERASGAGSCVYKWDCTKWSECTIFGKQNRNCMNIGNCIDTYKTPETEQNCIYLQKDIEEYEKQSETEKETKELVQKNIINKERIFIYFIILLVILSVIFYIKKGKTTTF